MQNTPMENITFFDLTIVILGVSVCESESEKENMKYVIYGDIQTNKQTFHFRKFHFNSKETEKPKKKKHLEKEKRLSKGSHLVPSCSNKTNNEKNFRNFSNKKKISGKGIYQIKSKSKTYIVQYVVAAVVDGR